MMDRRAFLRTTSGAAAGLASFGSLRCIRGTGIPAAAGTGGYGPLVPAGPELALPEGFSYVAFGRTGGVMSDGNATPPNHDGMCALPLPNGNVRLIRNHEVFRQFETRGLPGAPALTYDPKAAGGTTSLEIDPSTRGIVRDFISLDGTLNNCAGGPTPWGSWLSCEESYAGPADGYGRLHGYIFEVAARQEGQVVPRPLCDMGRFIHEAIAVDPGTSVVYETEDQQQSGLYRFLPNEPYGPGGPADLTAGGRLQMLAVRRKPRYDTASGQTPGARFSAGWVDIADPNPAEGAGADAVFQQGWALGGARFKRLEGAWFQEGVLYVDCTTGGDAQCGQIWSYTPEGPDRGTLELVFESPGQAVLDHPDNICASPRPGSGIVLCEDGAEENLYIRGLTPDGRIFDFAQNVLNDSEFAGSCFSPDGATLFVNIQRPGITFAIWGPWERGAL